MNNILNVAHIVSHPVPYFVPLYREINCREISNTVYYFSDITINNFISDEFNQEIEWDIPLLGGYEVKFRKSSRRKKIRNGFNNWPNWDILSEIGFGKYDVIWAHGYAHPNIWLAAILSFFSDTKLLIREEQTLLDRRPWYKRILKAAMLRTLFKMSYGLFIGENNRKYFEYYGMQSTRLYPARYCVDNNYFYAKSVEMSSVKNDVRSSFGITDDLPVILFAGKFIEKKQPMFLIETYARLRKEMPCRLLMVGDGPLRQSMEDLIRNLKIPDIVFSGFLNQTEMPRAYSAADIFVLPSSYMETWGLVVNEAMNFSLPIVVTDKVGCAADLVKDGWNGFVVGHRDGNALKDAMSRLVADSDLRRKFGQRSLELVSEYSIKRCADEIVAACLAVGGKNTRGRGVRS